MSSYVAIALCAGFLVVGLALGLLVGRARSHVALAQQQAELAKAKAQVDLLQQNVGAARSVADSLTPVTTTLRTLSESIERAERARVASQADVQAQLQSLGKAGQSLTAETGKLVAALKRSEVRGRWGELQLRSLVESAGLLEGVHFVEQDSVRTEDGLLRPDMVVKLGGGGVVLIDAKTPLDAYLDAELADDDADRDLALERHASAVAQHVERLSGKEYWRHYEGSAEMVVLFLPAEALLSAALSRDPGLLERAFAKRVVLATPTTLGALLRGVALAWRNQQLAENARQIQTLGAELLGRVSTMTSHFATLGRSLDAAVRKYNETLGSYESRVLVTARRISELGVAGDTPDTPTAVTTLPRSAGNVDA